MSILNTKPRYSAVTKILHAIIAFLFIAQIFLGYFMGSIAKKTGSYQVYGIHKSIGFTLLIVAIAFILWRAFHKKSAFPAYMTRWEKRLASWVHFLLYCGVLIMPLSGWLMSSYSGSGVSFWGLFNVTAPVTANKAMSGFFHTVHLSAAWMVAALIALHILGVLKHLLIDKHNILRRIF